MQLPLMIFIMDYQSPLNDIPEVLNVSSLFFQLSDVGKFHESVFERASYFYSTLFQLVYLVISARTGQEG